MQTSATTTSAPQFVCDPQGKIAAVTVSTPEEWNAFAAAFNAEPERFADFVDVEITALLSFEDTIFICLLEPFSGRIYGKAVEPSEGDTLYVLETDPLIVDYRSSPYGRYSVDSGLTCGFTEIWKIEGGSLFGCEDSILVIENLLFSDIGYKNTTEETTAMLVRGTKSLTVTNTVFFCCMFDQISEKNPMFVPNHLLAESVDELTVSRMIVADCDLSLWGSVGLLFDTVYANASFSQVAMLGCDIQSSLFAAESAEDATLFGILVHGTADYSDILFFDCHVRGSIASSFGHMGKVGMMKNICFDRCSFTTDYELPLCFSDTLSGALFFSEKRTEFYAPVDPETVAAFAMTEAELLTDAEIENVCVTNSVVMLPDGRELADYRAYGIIVENCLNIVD